MPNFDLDVDVEDFLNECSQSEIEEVKKWLIESDEINEFQCVDLSFLEEDFVKSLIKIKDSYLQLSIDEIEYLKQLSNKF